MHCHNALLLFIIYLATAPCNASWTKEADKLEKCARPSIKLTISKIDAKHAKENANIRSMAHSRDAILPSYDIGQD
jgi:hypothetical protein